MAVLTKPKRPSAKLVALAFAKANAQAGQAVDCDDMQDAETRAANLTRCGYIVAGDPYGWARAGKPAATVCCEQQGGANDCAPPADYYGRDAFFDITQHLPGWFWEWVNPGVALVWPC